MTTVDFEKFNQWLRVKGFLGNGGGGVRCSMHGKRESGVFHPHLYANKFSEYHCLHCLIDEFKIEVEMK